MRSFLGIVLIVFSFIATAQDSGRLAQPDLPGDINIDFGWNFVQNTPNAMETRWWPSRSFSVHYQRIMPFWNSFAFVANLGIGNDRIGFENNVNFQIDSTFNYFFDTLNVRNPSKNLLIMNYVDLPVELRFYPKKTTDGSGFFVAVGGFVGYRIESHNKIKYDVIDETRTDKYRSSFGLSNVRYGLTARVGWKPISFFYKQQFSNLFSEGPFPSDQQIITVGFSLTGF